MIRLGLCCAFRDEPIRFRTTTAAASLRISRGERLARIARIVQANAEALSAALQWCQAHGIGCFRVNSQILPLRTHPQAGYEVADLPGAEDFVESFRRCGRFAAENDIRLTLHPDQFVVLNSPLPSVVAASMAELAYQAEVAEWIGADVITIHGGGAYGDKRAAMERLRRALDRLSDAARGRIALENDDRVFTPADLLPHCESAEVPFVYDVHHHRCLPDGIGEAEAAHRALSTWNREPLFHISSPAGGWRAANPRIHHDFIQARDLPDLWVDLDLTVEVEARAKEVAVLRLRRALARRRGPTTRETRSATKRARRRPARAAVS